MKRIAKPRVAAPADRKACVDAVVANAKARGEKIPRGVKLIGFHPLDERAQAHAQTLASTARQALSRGRAAAA